MKRKLILKRNFVMTHIRKAALICDKCGAQMEIDPSVDKPFFSHFVQEESAWKDWLAVTRDHHLCPACSKEYNDCKAEMDAKLKQIAGIKTIEFDV